MPWPRLPVVVSLSIFSRRPSPRGNATLGSRWSPPPRRRVIAEEPLTRACAHGPVVRDDCLCFFSCLTPPPLPPHSTISGRRGGTRRLQPEETMLSRWTGDGSWRVVWV
ncbi:hypothetical protein BU14_0784s0006 [Porphyra umbilicalis]|uniref:Uncharacterized protein n=1 Tax=Porphyra umbilicalis TaxID=2786 RepID=A0A1X6NP21_PORUM|nr:hypothetical protein BU14_0784s0006 [Porphyra umbilicalis]|eukprot:OSX70337.1 hypothetical protein BU14_0784s0006 [Porphyra umbilicalis]